MGLDLCRVVLVRPHYPGNVGATARVMRNMGLTELVLVDPVANLTDRQARQFSTHGEEILRAARVVPDLQTAVADCTLATGTSARTGGLFRRQTVGPPDEILPHVAAAAQGRGGRPLRPDPLRLPGFHLTLRAAPSF
jgi:tRNA C32,U32 (ribose-2'-O)-methylase TrmJ